MDSATNRTALQAAEDFPQVHAAVGRHPNHAEGFDDADLADLQALAAHPRCAAIGETGLDYFRDYAPRADQERAFHAQIELARATGKPLVIHTRAAEDDTLATLKRARTASQVVMHCFSMPDRLDECLAEGWWISFAGNVTYPKADRPGRRPPSASPTIACWWRPTLRTSRRSRCARSATSRPSSPTPRASWPSAAASPTRSSSAWSSQRGRAVRVVTGELPTQPSLRRMRQFGVRPKRDLGQNFLVDSNILGVIERAAELAGDDVVLEIGGGLGVLSEHLAARAAHVHVVELDRALVPALRGRARRRTRTRRCTSPTRWSSTCARCDPAPTKVVANLPYGIAASAILRTIEELDDVTRWVAMIQRRSASASPPRRAPRPTASPACSRSSPATCACTARSRARSSTRCPTSTRCSSCSTAPARRRRPALRALVRAAFAHRRKALARSLALAPGYGPDVRERARAALQELGPPGRRARRAPGARRSSARWRRRCG